MLRVWKVSGEELARVPVAELSDASELKRYLRVKNNLPICLQELLYNGALLQDDAKLFPSMDVQLILSSLALRGAEAALELLEAAEAGEVEAMRLLIDADVDGDLLGQHMATALLAGASEGHVEVVRFLIEAGVATETEWHGETALSGAASEGHVEVVRLLLPTMDVQFCATALINASSAGHVEVVRLLLQSSADVDCQHSETALSAASSEGHVDVARLLLEARADVNLSNQHGETALVAASFEGKVDVVRLLLEAGAHVDFQHGNTPLMAPPPVFHDLHCDTWGLIREDEAW
ncbi:mask [Symbiodinium sp. CCMP2592]|nr:mask [Symbiodinium sp. CCMP2592]